MKHTRSMSLFLILFFMIGQMSLHSVQIRTAPVEVKVETEFQPLIEFKFSLAQLAEFVQSYVPTANLISMYVSYPSQRIHLVSVLLNSHHISLPPPNLAA